MPNYENIYNEVRLTTDLIRETNVRYLIWDGTAQTFAKVVNWLGDRYSPTLTGSGPGTTDVSPFKRKLRVGPVDVHVNDPLMATDEGYLFTLDSRAFAVLIRGVE